MDDLALGIDVHYNDVIMSAMASQITSLTFVYSTRRSEKISKFLVTGLCEGNSTFTGEIPAQKASNAEKVSIWWRHHVYRSVAAMAASSVKKKYFAWWELQYIHPYIISVHRVLLYLPSSSVFSMVESWCSKFHTDINMIKFWIYAPNSRW